MKIVIYLDSLSKRLVKLNNRLINSEDVVILNDLKKLKETDLDDARCICCFEGALKTRENIQLLKMYGVICNLNYIFFVHDLKSVEDGQLLGSVYQCDTGDISYELLQAGIYGDLARSSTAVDDKKSYLFAKKLLETNKSDDIWQLAVDYVQNVNTLENLKKTVTQLEDSNNTLLRQNVLLSENAKYWEDGYKKLFEKVLHSNEELQQFETIFTTDIYKKVSLRRYPNKPTIVYLKVFSEFVGLQTLIETLVDSFRLQRRKSVKVVQLFDSVNDRQIRLLPEHYHRLHGVYTNNEITSNDFLVKVGDYTTMLDRLLVNQEGLDILILVDNKNFDDVVLQGSFLQFNLCRTVKQAEVFALPQNYTIVNQKVNGWNVWIPIDTANLNNKEKFIKLSSRKVIAKILDMSDKFANSY